MLLATLHLGCSVLRVSFFIGIIRGLDLNQCLIALFAIKIGSEKLARRYPKRAIWFFYMNTLRNAFVVIILTLGAYVYAHPRKDAKGNYPINILKTVPRGTFLISVASVRALIVPQ
jgi:hypothetical protein